MVSADSREISDAELRAKRKPRRNGLLLADEALLKAMDKSGAYAFLPVSAKEKDGELHIDWKASSLATLPQMEVLMRYMEKTLRQTAQALREGGVFIDPVRSAGPDGVDACRFCDMRAVCRFEGQPREPVSYTHLDVYKRQSQRHPL